jgi:hypothetical protein
MVSFDAIMAVRCTLGGLDMHVASAQRAQPNAHKHPGTYYMYRNHQRHEAQGQALSRSRARCVAWETTTRVAGAVTDRGAARSGPGGGQTGGSP